jgi:triphosphoribosyl-dephospho-CoA synthase
MNKDAFVGHCAALAGLLEVSAEKPGNVTPTYDFPDTKFHHFLASSVALEGPMRRLAEDGDYRIGAGMLDAVKASHKVQKGGNAQLGIILLFGPLAKAAGLVEGNLNAGHLRRSLGMALRLTDNKDALDAFRAINFGHVGGLNPVKTLDVRDKRTLAKLRNGGTTLLEWMSVGKDINSVCHEYATDYDITFELGLPVLVEGRPKGLGNAIVHTYLTILSRHLDTHISGKWGHGVATHVSDKAAGIIKKGSVWTRDGMGAIKRFTNYLRKGHINPGATADLTASAIYVALLTGLEP